MAEYHRQAGDYTQEAVRQLKASPEYKAHTQRCLRYMYYTQYALRPELDAGGH